MARRVNFYATGEFNRAVERREDLAWIRERLADPASRLYPIWRLRNFVSNPDAPRVVGQVFGTAMGIVAGLSPLLYLMARRNDLKGR